eukprot:scpid11953/ scgid34501/ 
MHVRHAHLHMLYLYMLVMMTCLFHQLVELCNTSSLSVISESRNALWQMAMYNDCFCMYSVLLCTNVHYSSALHYSGVLRAPNDLYICHDCRDFATERIPSESVVRAHVYS